MALTLRQIISSPNAANCWLVIDEKNRAILIDPGESNKDCQPERVRRGGRVEWLFTGDTLFRENHGRTDLPTGNAVAMQKSLAKLCRLPPETVIYPGHNETWTIGKVRTFFAPTMLNVKR